MIDKKHALKNSKIQLGCFPLVAIVLIMTYPHQFSGRSQNKFSGRFDTYGVDGFESVLHR